MSFDRFLRVYSVDRTIIILAFVRKFAQPRREDKSQFYSFPAKQDASVALFPGENRTEVCSFKEWPGAFGETTVFPAENVFLRRLHRHGDDEKGTAFSLCLVYPPLSLVNLSPHPRQRSRWEISRTKSPGKSTARLPARCDGLSDAEFPGRAPSIPQYFPVYLNTPTDRTNLPANRPRREPPYGRESAPSGPSL